MPFPPPPQPIRPIWKDQTTSCVRYLLCQGQGIRVPSGNTRASESRHRNPIQTCRVTWSAKQSGRETKLRRAGESGCPWNGLHSRTTSCALSTLFFFFCCMIEPHAELQALSPVLTSVPTPLFQVEWGGTGESNRINDEKCELPFPFVCMKVVPPAGSAATPAASGASGAGAAGTPATTPAA